MKTKLKVDSMGRVVLPIELRRRFGIHKGSVLTLEIDTDSIRLRKKKDTPTLSEDGGLIVHEGEPVGNLAYGVDTAREERDRANWGLQQ